MDKSEVSESVSNTSMSNFVPAGEDFVGQPTTSSTDLSQQSKLIGLNSKDLNTCVNCQEFVSIPLLSRNHLHVLGPIQGT